MLVSKHSMFLWLCRSPVQRPTAEIAMKKVGQSQGITNCHKKAWKVLKQNKTEQKTKPKQNKKTPKQTKQKQESELL